MQKEMSPISILKTFFELKPGQKLSDFSQEVKQLSEEEKTELVDLAAKELGVTVKPKDTIRL